MKRLGGKLWYMATALKKREINDLKVFSELYLGAGGGDSAGEISSSCTISAADVTGRRVKHSVCL